MELGVDEALQFAVVAHREGRLKDAEELYRAILVACPDHADANHNLGALAASVGRVAEALPHFRGALDSNPAVDQFWISYAEGLLNAGQIEGVKELLLRAERDRASPRVVGALQNFSKQQPIRRANDDAGDISSLNLLEFNDLPGDARAATADPAPSAQDVRALLELFQMKHFSAAEEMASSMTRRFPTHPIGWKVLGAIFHLTGRISESLVPMQKAVDLAPSDTEALNNLGGTFRDAGRFTEAESTLRRAVKLKPSFAEAWSNLAVTLQSLGQVREAEASARRARDLQPKNAATYVNLGAILISQKKWEEAQHIFEDAILIDPDVASTHYNLGLVKNKLGLPTQAESSFRKAVLLEPCHGGAKHMLASLMGETTPAAPLDYVEELFDDFASTFDRDLVEDLRYQTPKFITKVLTRKVPQPVGKILDLGCGTGLMGVELAGICGYLEGVDVSERMLDVARARGIYDRLSKGDIVSFLSTSLLNFNLFLASDVFVYFGELGDVFRIIKSRCESGGHFAFSVEHSDGNGFELRPSGRYAHSKPYIDSLCSEHGYSLEHFELCDLRLEDGKFLRGGLYLLSF